MGALKVYAYVLYELGSVLATIVSTCDTLSDTLREVEARERAGRTVMVSTVALPPLGKFTAAILTPYARSGTECVVEKVIAEDLCDNDYYTAVLIGHAISP